MSDDFYPDVMPGGLLPAKLIVQGMEGDPLWLERRECPYDDETKHEITTFWEMVRANRAETVSSNAPPAIELDDQGEIKWDTLSDELTKLYNDLRSFQTTGTGDGSRLDPKEQMAFFRTATSLMDKIVGLGERTMNIKQVSEFQGRVMAVFEAVLKPDQRTRAMEMLKNG